ncbi:hypothetical protein TSTA_066100, partial [Talaromyces stipitatus ATCC 10500]
MIQHSSQRLILCIGASKDNSTTHLNRDFYIRIPSDLQRFFPRCEFLKVEQPLYRIPKAGNHWFRMYYEHYMKQLAMETSTYNPCLLHCRDLKQGFSIIGMQTDDTLIVADEAFA